MLSKPFKIVKMHNWSHHAQHVFVLEASITIGVILLEWVDGLKAVIFVGRQYMQGVATVGVMIRQREMIFHVHLEHSVQYRAQHTFLDVLYAKLEHIPWRGILHV